MPFVNIKVAGPRLSPGQVRLLQEGATRLMAEVLRKKAGLTAVLVEEVGAGTWSIGGLPANVVAHLDAKVTSGTNSEEEKERFVADAMRLLRSVLGPDLDPVTYVVVHELAGGSWGWNGQTQAQRAAASPRDGAAREEIPKEHATATP